MNSLKIVLIFGVCGSHSISTQAILGNITYNSLLLTLTNSLILSNNYLKDTQLENPWKAELQIGIYPYYEVLLSVCFGIAYLVIKILLNALITLNNYDI